MNALELYKFVQKNSLEYHWAETDSQTDVVLFVPIELLSEFANMLGYTILTNKEIRPVLKMNHCVFEMDSICEHFDISVHDVFEQKED